MSSKIFYEHWADYSPEEFDYNKDEPVSMGVLCAHGFNHLAADEDGSPIVPVFVGGFPIQSTPHDECILRASAPPAPNWLLN